MHSSHEKLADLRAEITLDLLVDENTWQARCAYEPRNADEQIRTDLQNTARCIITRTGLSIDRLGLPELRGRLLLRVHTDPRIMQARQGHAL